MKTSHVYLIAEAGVNHNGSLSRALKMVDVAAEAGADAVKFQTFRAKEVIARHAQKANYQIRHTGKNESQLEMVKKLELSEAKHEKIAQRCRQRKIVFLSTPFDLPSVQLLLRLHVPKIKIPSGEITNAPLLLEIAKSKKPLILSTGMSTLKDIREALGVIAFVYLATRHAPSTNAFAEAFRSSAAQTLLRKRVTLLHCVTEYPAPFGDVHLRAMDLLKETFHLPVGYSDHTAGIHVAIAAVARGAVCVEKHFTLDRALPGPDHRASLEPEELRQMIRSIRDVEEALGERIKKPAPSELKNLPIARKSLVAAKKICKGEALSVKNLTAKRPGGGVSPMLYWEDIGKNSKEAYRPDELIAHHGK